MLRRGRAGLGGVIKRKEDVQALRRTGQDLQEAQLSHAATLLETFRDSLSRFAEEHKSEINSDPLFRRHFHTMCSRIGVDPLNSQKGFWAEYLGFGDFYYELAVQITEVCIATRPVNGGVLSLPDLLEHLRRRRQPSKRSRGRKNRFPAGRSAEKEAQEISGDDVLTAVSKLKVLGGGIRVLKVGSKHMIFSVPQELSNDELGAMQIAQSGGGFFTKTTLRDQGWVEERIEPCIRTLLLQEMVWVDQSGANGEEKYWFVSLWSDATRAGAESDDEGGEVA